MAEVIFDSVDKVYAGGVHAVRGLCLEVSEGELVVLLGPSGSGKSTVLRMVAGLERITSGTISIGGRVVNRLSPRQRDVAMVFQDNALYPHLTVYENMAFGLKMRGFSKREIRARIEECARILALEDLLPLRPMAISGGQRQRVALGRAMVRRPAAFLFDEPLSSLDAPLRAQMRVEIDRLHTRLAATMLYVTHDQAEAMTLGDRIAILDAGVVQQVGDPLSLYNSPVNRFVAGFLGTPPMNFFEGRIGERDGRLIFAAEGGLVLPITDAGRMALAGRRDRAVTLGIRPEHIGSPATEHANHETRITATVEAVEPIGAESHVYLATGDTRFVCRVGADRQFRVGREVTLAVSVEKARFFDARTGEAA